MISLGETNEELEKSLRRKGIKKDEDDLWKMEGITWRGRTCRFQTGATLIRTRNFPDSSMDYGCLQHEIFHAVTYIMDSIGQPLSVGVSDEAYAYLIGHVTEQTMRKIGDTLRKK